MVDHRVLFEPHHLSRCWPLDTLRGPLLARRLVDLHHTFGEESCNSVGHTRSNSFPWGFTLSPRVAELAEDWLAERESLSPQAHAPGGSSPEAGVFPIIVLKDLTATLLPAAESLVDALVC